MFLARFVGRKDIIFRLKFFKHIVGGPKVTIRYYLKCPVCGKITLIKFQVGFIESFPVNIYCGCCNSLMKGKVEKEARLSFINGELLTEIKNDEPDYIYFISAEFLVPQMRPFTGNNELYAPSPYMQACSDLGLDYINSFQNTIAKVLELEGSFGTTIYNVNTLYLNGKTDLLRNEIHKVLPSRLFPMSNELEIIQALHNINIKPLQMIESTYFNNFTSFFFSEWKAFFSAGINYKTLVDFINFIVSKNLFDSFNKKYAVFSRNIIEKLYLFLPILSLRYYDCSKLEIFDTRSLTTVSVEEIMPLYQNGYELLADSLVFLVGFDNLLSRYNFMQLKDSHAIGKYKGKIITTLNEFHEIDKKALKLSYITGDQRFENTIKDVCNKNIRNSIGHYDYELTNAFKQTIMFKNTITPTRSVEQTLLEVTSSVWNIYLALYCIYELCYQFEKIKYTNLGQKITIRPEDYANKANWSL